MSAKDPAFPLVEVNHDGTPYCQWDGLTKREYFAAMALQGLLAGNATGGRAEWFAANARDHADALIVALNESQP